MYLKDLQKYTEVKIPNSDLVIILKHNLPWYDQIEVAKIKDNIERARYLIWKMIDSWNLKDDSENIVPINKETVDSFGADIIFPLKSAMDKIIAEKELKKKNLLKNSSIFSKVLRAMHLRNM